MNGLRKLTDKIKPAFEKGGKLGFLHSTFDAFETFLFVPDTVTKRGAHVRDSVDLKRILIIVVLALLPAMLFGMWNVGYQHSNAFGLGWGFWNMFWYGLVKVIPLYLVSYIVGLGIEFAVAQWKGEEIQEGYLVTGLLVPLIVPVSCPLWMLALAVAFSVIFVKEIFGGTGMNIFNPAIVARAFLFFSYPNQMSGENVWVSKESILGLGKDLPDTFTMATPLGTASAGHYVAPPLDDMIIGLMPGSIGETSVIAIAIGAVILLWTRIASWRTMVSVFVGGALTAALFHSLGATPLMWYEHLFLGGFCFGAVFMATDPVTSARTEQGKYIYGFLIGVVAILVRVANPGYPEGMMLAILLMNALAPLIDYCFVQRNISKRAKRAAHK